MGDVLLRGHVVELLDYEPPMRVIVEDTLAVQFTAVHPDTGTLTFRFYADEGDTWRRVKDDEQD